MIDHAKMLPGRIKIYIPCKYHTGDNLFYGNQVSGSFFPKRCTRYRAIEIMFSIYMRIIWSTPLNNVALIQRVLNN